MLYRRRRGYDERKEERLHAFTAGSLTLSIRTNTMPLIEVPRTLLPLSKLGKVARESTSFLFRFKVMNKTL